ncbi:GxxExxY protein [candidate division KSB1 bacterium]|nr:GxxExxY protein [candidate division KSB1 bacterium]
MKNLLYEDLTGKIRQAAFEIHNYFGNGFLEKVYENTLVYKLRQLEIKCEQQMPLKVYFKDNIVVGEYFADIVVENKIILELKAIENLNKIHYAQVKNYLKATKYKLGILINFGKPVLEYKRIIL